MNFKTDTTDWNFWRNVAFVLAACVTVYFGFFAYFDPPIRISSIYRGPSDRYLHVAALATVTLVFMIGRKRWLFCVIAMLTFAVGLELLQLWHPTRVAAWDDLFASLSGVAVGAVLATILNSLLAKRSASSVAAE